MGSENLLKQFNSLSPLTDVYSCFNHEHSSFWLNFTENKTFKCLNLESWDICTVKQVKNTDEEHYYLSVYGK